MNAPSIGKNLLRTGIALAIVAVFLLPASSVHAQVPFGGFIGVTYQGACTASAPTGMPFMLVGFPAGPYMYVPGSVVFPYGPPSHPGQAILGFAAGYFPCLYWSVCGVSPCPLPFPPHPGGLLVILSGTAF